MNDQKTEQSETESVYDEIKVEKKWKELIPILMAKS